MGEVCAAAGGPRAASSPALQWPVPVQRRAREGVRFHGPGRFAARRLALHCRGPGCWPPGRHHRIPVTPGAIPYYGLPGASSSNSTGILTGLPSQVDAGVARVARDEHFSVAEHLVVEAERDPAQIGERGAERQLVVEVGGRW